MKRMTVELIASTESQEAQELMVQHAEDIFQRLIYIRANLPKVLANLIESGESEKATDAMLAWGKGTKPIETIWLDVTETQSSREVKPGIL